MATRFYLPSSGAAPVTPPALTGWTAGTSAHYAAPAALAKSNTALTDFTVAETLAANFNVPVAAFVSAVLAAQSISGTVSAVVRAIESASSSDDSLQLGVYLIAGDGSSIKSTLYAGHTAALGADPGTLGQEIASAAAQTRIIPSGTALDTQSAAAGDRLMLVLGYRTHEASLTSRASTLRLGDPTGTADFALTSGLTTDLAPWVELSGNLQFGADQPFDTLADTFDGATGLWPNSYGGFTVTGGQGVIDCDAGQFSGFKSARAYHLTDSYVGGQFFPPAAAGGSSAYMSIIVTSGTAGTDAAFNIDAGFMGVLLREGFSDAGAVFVTYDPDDHAWLRVREDAGTLLWEASPDGATWSTLRTETTPAWADDPDLAFIVECKRADGTDNTGAVDNVNTFGEAPGAIEGTGALTGSAGTLAGAGGVTIASLGALTAAAGMLTGTGGLSVPGSGSLTAAAGTVGGSGAVSVAATGALTAASGVLEGSGSTGIAGTGALAGAAGALAGAGTLTISGSGALVAAPGVLAGGSATRVVLRPNTGTVTRPNTGTVTRP